MTFNPEIANTLPNGARIIDRRKIGDTWVWLADFGGAQPYVTWVSDAGCPGETVWGHYTSSFKKAYDDFCERIAQQCQYLESFVS